MSATVRVYRVAGMTCDHCVGAVAREVGALDAVTDVHAELSTGDVTVRSTRPLTDAELEAALDEAGYRLSS
jgi:copper chaperone